MRSEEQSLSCAQVNYHSGDPGCGPAEGAGKEEAEVFMDRQNVSYLADGFAGHRGCEVPAGRQSGLSVANRKQKQRSQKRERYQDRFFRFSFISYLPGYFLITPLLGAQPVYRPYKILANFTWADREACGGCWLYFT